MVLMQSATDNLPSGGEEASESLHTTQDATARNEPSSSSSIDLSSSNNFDLLAIESINLLSNSSTSNTTNSSKGKTRQKNDKPVEVCHDNKVIARFKTQTECARYLRATPEAVSYHCSKGGGVCNGLLVRPVVANSMAEGTESPLDFMYFGLFDGSSKHRPEARPQLSPDVVSMLKAWLLSPGHIDNPYPTGPELDILMEKTKLDKTQLKHWFNNARKRIWKPLVKSEGRLIPKFGKIGKRSRSVPGRMGSDATSDEDGTPDAAPASSDVPSDNKKGGKRTSSKRRRTNDSISTGGGAGMNMCHSIGGQDSFQRESDDGRYNNSNNNLSMLMNRYNQIFGNMGMFQGNNGGGLPMNIGNSMMNSSSMNRSMMMDPTAGTFPNNISSGSGKSYFCMGVSNNSGGGSFMGRDGGASSFQGCMEVNGGASNFGGMRNANGQDLLNNSTSNAMNYCQPLIQPNSTQGFPKKKNSIHSATLIESVRSNAVFKQQVANMAMNEASTSFKEMEDAFARSKDILAQVREENMRSDQSVPEGEDVRVMEANAHAKACQNTAMFKLKVSQRASEEAASAYDCYLRLVEDNDSMM
jgi:hypothetical protein